MNEAYKAMIEWGIVGAVLAVILGAFITLMWYTIKTSNEVLREKDAELSRVNDLRVEGATEATAAIKDMANEMRRLVDILKLQNGGNDDSQDD